MIDVFWFISPVDLELKFLQRVSVDFGLKPLVLSPFNNSSPFFLSQRASRLKSTLTSSILAWARWEMGRRSFPACPLYEPPSSSIRLCKRICHFFYLLITPLDGITTILTKMLNYIEVFSWEAINLYYENKIYNHSIN